MAARSEIRAMRWWAAALASGVSRRRVGGAALAACLALVLACGGSAASGGSSGSKASSFTGYAFDACNAPKTAALQSWLASPYRALGIYIGGSNRACANGQLSPTWASSAVSLGWGLIPIYVGLQAPCVDQNGVARIISGSAASEGTAAADDADDDASALGLPGSSPIYFDMEGYALHNAGCTAAVQSFVGAWVAELHALGHLAGVYGSAASTIRDLQPLATTSSSPDDVWIADWNGAETVFGNPYLPDTLWGNHQRLHQYRGGHRETWGGVTIDVDSNYVDGAVVGTAGIAPPPVAAANPSEASTAGSVSAADGVSKVSWPAGAFQQSVVVSLTPTSPPTPMPGFGSGGYGVQLSVAETAPAALTKGFTMPLTIHVNPLPGALAPMRSTNGTNWKPIPEITEGSLPPGIPAGFTRGRNGSFDITTAGNGYFGLLPELKRPPAPAHLSGTFSHGRLVLRWPRSIGTTGPATSYQVTISNHPLLAIPATTASISALHHTSPSVFRVVATDSAGKSSEPSKAVVVLPSTRPSKLPKTIPHWAFALAAWQEDGREGTRPDAPKIPPRWFWRWSTWEAAPFHFRT
jgi:hypothetical protein